MVCIYNGYGMCVGMTFLCRFYWNSTSERRYPTFWYPYKHYRGSGTTFPRERTNPRHPATWKVTSDVTTTGQPYSTGTSMQPLPDINFYGKMHS